MTDANDNELLAAAVEFTLELLDIAERSRSFPDDENERYKRQAIKLERRRYKELRARLVADEGHGVPVARAFLEAALGLYPTVFPDNAGEELYEQWLQDQRSVTDLDQ